MIAAIERRFTALLAALCLLYLALESVYIVTLPLVMDEFQGAYSVSLLAGGLPYRDFIPYKTVLGYYLQLLPMQLSDDTWSQLMLIKLFVAVATAAGVFVAARLLASQFRRSAVCLGTLLLFCVSTFLERSAELRVDMLTSLAGLISLALLLNRRFVGAGVLAGLSFLISQKGVYFLVAGGLACGMHWWFAERHRQAFRDAIHFSLAGAAPILSYVLVWSCLSSLSVVIRTVFLAHTDIATEQLYTIRHYWFQTWERNPYFYAASALALGMLYERRATGRVGYRDGMLFTYGFAMVGFALWHKQPWPYFFVIIIPTLYVLIVVFIDTRIDAVAHVSLPFVLLFAVFGVAAPLFRISDVMGRDSGFQRSTVALADAILESDDTYLAGTQMLHRHEHAAGEHLGWLDARHLSRVKQLDSKKLIETLRASRLKLLVMNRRITRLPAPLLDYLAENYRSFHGAIHLYSPIIRQSQFQLDLDGTYRVLALAPLELDGQSVRPGQTVQLARGTHTASTAPFQLALSPNVDAALIDPAYERHEELFDRPYDY